MQFCGPFAFGLRSCRGAEVQRCRVGRILYGAPFDAYINAAAMTALAQRLVWRFV